MSGFNISMLKDAIKEFESDTDLDIINKAIITILHMSQIVRKEGLLALEESFIENPDEEFCDVSSMVLLVVDGTDPEIVSEIFTNSYFANKYEGNEALAQYILRRGVLLVQEGMHPYTIKEILISLLPDKLKTECRDLVDMRLDEWNEIHVRKINKKFAEWTPINPSLLKIDSLVNAVNNYLSLMTNDGLQRVMMNVEVTTVELCIVALSDESRLKIFDTMSSRLADLVKEDLIEIRDKVQTEEYLEKIRHSMKVLMNTITLLESKGEIIIVEV